MSEAYIIFEGVSDVINESFGANLYLDEIKIEVLTPTLTVNPTSLNFNDVVSGTTSSTQNITVSGTNLTGNITWSKGGVAPDVFNITPASLSSSGGNFGVSFTPVTAGDYSASITISSAGAENKTVTLSGMGILPPAPVALPATGTTHNSFIANWSAVTNAAHYILNVYTKDGSANIPVQGYEDLNVGNVTLKEITGLISNTTYYYTVKSVVGGITSPPSEEVEVTTEDDPDPCAKPGTGTQQDPYIICTAQDLADLATFVNSGNGAQTVGKFYILMNDIDLSDYATGTGWTPIGDGNANDNTTVFFGHFDGNNKVITNLKINQTQMYKSCLGLFGNLGNGATVENLGIEKCVIYANTGSMVGGLVGMLLLPTEPTP
jgi:hypothetical protein